MIPSHGFSGVVHDEPRTMSVNPSAMVISLRGDQNHGHELIQAKVSFLIVMDAFTPNFDDPHRRRSEKKFPSFIVRTCRTQPHSPSHRFPAIEYPPETTRRILHQILFTEWIS